MAKLKQLFREKKIIFLILILAVCILSFPTYKKAGIEVSYVLKDSPFKDRILENTQIFSVNSHKIKTVDDYAAAALGLKLGDKMALETSAGAYSAVLNATQADNITPYIGINVKRTTPLRLKLGLELQGGARVTLKPIIANNTNITSELYSTIATVLTKRLDAYGLQGVIPRIIQDFQGNKYIVVEMAGEGSEKLVDLVKSVGKFELNVLNETIFGGEAIVPPIGEPGRDAVSGSWGVGLSIKADSAKTFRDSYVKLTPTSPASCTDDSSCSSGFACARPDIIGRNGLCLPKITMLLDGKEEFSAPPAQSLYQNWKEGEASSNLVVQTKSYEDAKRVQVVLEAGRLPSQIESLQVISQDYVDPKLGRDFFRGAGTAGLAAILLVGAVIFIRYRKMKITLPIMFTCIAEVVILLGVASVFNKLWAIDLPAIAGIIASVGTGVEQQIIITDEILSGAVVEAWEIKRRTKAAFGIIVVALSTVVAAMFPLLLENIFPGLYALKGFAISTIIGILIGYFITRPAYAKMAEIFLLEEHPPVQ